MTPYEFRATVDISKPNQSATWRTLACVGNAKAHKFVITIKDGNERVPLDGVEIGLHVLHLKTNKSVYVTGSVDDDGNAVVEMHSDCYSSAMEGQICCTVTLTEGGAVMSAARVYMNIDKASGGVVIDPTGKFYSLEELLAQIDLLKEATEDAQAAAAEMRQAISDSSATELQQISSAGSAQTQAVNAAGSAQISEIENKGANTLATIPADYATTYNRAINSAVAIPDESALSASHELHAQKDYPLNVAVHGYTIQEGTGDPSPDNMRPIKGLEAAQVRAGGKNLWEFGDRTVMQGKILAFKEPLKPGRYVISGVTTSTDTDNYENTVVIGDCNITFNRNTRREYAFLLDAEAPHVALYSARSNNNAAGDTSAWTNMMIEYGTQASGFEPYNPDATTINPPLLPDGAPLMEGDTVENWARSGCDKKIVLDGDSSGLGMGIGYLIVKLSEKAQAVTIENQETLYGAYSSRYVPRTWVQLDTNKKDGIAVRYGDGSYLVIRDSSLTTIQEWKDALAANSLTVFYRSTDYTPDKDLRVCRVVRNYRSAKISDFAWQTEGLNAYGLRSFYAPAIGTVYANGAVQCEKLPSEGAHWQAVNNNIYSDKTNNRLYIIIKPDELEAGIGTVEALVAAVGDATVVYRVKEETYMTDPLPLLPPAALESDTVTVTGSGETEVEYAHETKHYIDSQIAAAVALALNG